MVGWRSVVGLLAWGGFLAAMVALHHVHPPAELALAGPHWTVTPTDPPMAPVAGVQLPHVWRHAAPGMRGVRYEAEVTLDRAPDALWVVYIPSLSINAAVFVNGARIGDGGSLAEPLARQSYRPLLFVVPPTLLRAGANVVSVEVRATPAGAGHLQQVYLGPQARLEPYRDLRHFLKLQFYAGLIAVMMVLGIIMFGVWLARRDERVYLWYAMCTVTFLLYAMFIAATSLPLPSLWWDCLQRIVLLWVLTCITLFISHFVGLSQPRLAVAMGWVCVGGPVVLATLALVLPPDTFYIVLIRGWLNSVLAGGLYATWIALRELWQRRTTHNFWMAVSGGSVMGTGAHDVLFENGLIAPFNGFYFHYGMPLVLIVFTTILGLRFLNALRESEVLNRELDARVKQKEAALEHSYAEVKQLEQQRVLAEERERIQRDMHDGLGGTLVSALAGLEMQGERESGAAQSLRSALDDLRLMIYSLDPASGTLRAVLGTLRSRLERLGEDAGLAIEWDLQGLPPDLALERGVTLQAMRIVQEAFTNTLKHARAKTFNLTATGPGAGSAGVTLEMRDDGAGFDGSTARAGSYGLSNMRVRAQKIGGTLEIGAGNPGTRVLLRVPAAYPPDHMNP